MLACSAGLALFASAASAGEPCTSGRCGSSSQCATLDECQGGVCGSRGCGGHFGRSGICNKCGRQHAGFDDDGPERWSDEWYAMNGGPVASPQRYHAGKLWPPYPRPSQRPQCSTLYHASTYWPHPYNCWDRAWVKNVLAVQTANGWMQATTLCGYHFDDETQMLNESGRNQLRWILEQAPPQFRTVYVQAATDRTSSQARQAAVETEAAEMAGAASAPVVVRPVQLAGRPANEVDALRRSELQTMPQPRIQMKTLGSESGDGS
ncbi:MAG: hypothetical protein M3552_12040 [Planctomycetota bacterium]|nr:hypothetical protein [Planctomycetaceae bacterium]MDQ3331365.1 hypothetical protein [Planctomycetota bacterium]